MDEPRTAAVALSVSDLRQLLRLFREIFRGFDSAAEVARKVRADVRAVDDELRRVIPIAGTLPLTGWWTVSAAQLRACWPLMARLRVAARSLDKSGVIGVHVRLRDIGAILTRYLQLDLFRDDGRGSAL